MTRPPAMTQPAHVAGMTSRSRAGRTSWAGRRLALLLIATASSVACSVWSSASDAREWARPGDPAAWQGCPAPQTTAPVADALWLQVAPDHLRCQVPGRSGESLADDLTRKAQLHLVPGDFFLPREAGVHALHLPFCVRTLEGVLAAEPGRPGQLEVSVEEVFGAPYLRYAYEDSMTDEQGERWTWNLQLSGYAAELSAGVRIDERAWPRGGTVWRSALCAGDSCDDSDDVRLFDLCPGTGAADQQHRFRFAGGNLEVDVMLASSEWPLLGHPTRAAGRYAGIDFEVTSYWDLSQQLTWRWDAARDFALRFATPIGETCGLLVQAAYPYVGADAGWGTEVYAMGCDGELVVRELDSVSFVDFRPPPDSSGP